MAAGIPAGLSTIIVLAKNEFIPQIVFEKI
jgi:hypothetical protein